MNWKIIGIISLLNAALFFGLGAKFGSSTKTEIKEVVKIQTQERVRTVIKEQPDGTKTTVVESVTNTDSRSDLNQASGPSRSYGLTLGVGANVSQRLEPTYSLGIDRYMGMGMSIGAYGRTDKEVGLTFRYDF